MNKNAVFRAFDAYNKAANEATKQLREKLDRLGLTVEGARPLVIEWAADRYACPTKESTSPRNRGAVVLDKGSAQFFAADKAARRMMDALTGDADAEKAEGGAGRSGKREELEIPADIAALAARLVALCNEYEGSKRLAAQAVAQAFAK